MTITYELIKLIKVISHSNFGFNMEWNLLFFFFYILIFWFWYLSAPSSWNLISSFFDRFTSSKRPLEIFVDVPPLLLAITSEIAVESTKIAYLCSAFVRCIWWGLIFRQMYSLHSSFTVYSSSRFFKTYTRN